MINDTEELYERYPNQNKEAEEINLRYNYAKAISDGPCQYCGLSSDDMSKCRSGFPGCGRMDDIMLGEYILHQPSGCK